MAETNTFTFVYKTVAKLFWIIVGYAFLFATIVIIKYFLKLNFNLSSAALRFWGITLCMLAILGGVISPTILRIIFPLYATKKKRLTMEEFLFLQKLAVIIPLSASFFANLAFLLQLPRIFLYPSLLAALYGIYSSRPAKQKLALELRYYGLDL